MTKNIKTCGQSFLNKYEIFIQKILKVIFNNAKQQKVMLNNEKQPIKINLQPFILHILCLVILTKVDTSQVPQQNVHWKSTVKAQISIIYYSEDSSVLPLLVSKY